MIGFLCVNKPRGILSTKVVSAAKKLTGEKVGHLGTLDPLAEGVLPIAIGKATRLFNYFLNKKKTYLSTCEFGYETTTLDSGGERVKTGQTIPTRKEIEQVLPSFIGKLSQLPPDFSAKRINGKRAYDLARAGEKLKLNPKEIEVFNLKIISYENGKLTLQMEVSAGTYVRAINRDIALKLNTCATTLSILRQKSGPFSLENSVDLSSLSAQTIVDNLISIDDALSGLAEFKLSKQQETDLLCGKAINVNQTNQENVLFKTENGAVYGIGEIKNKTVIIQTFLLDKEN